MSSQRRYSVIEISLTRAKLEILKDPSVESVVYQGALPQWLKRGLLPVVEVKQSPSSDYLAGTQTLIAGREFSKTVTRERSRAAISWF